jgi:NTP pyrophosphatase (non-canonical NTP hydrolase)
MEYKNYQDQSQRTFPENSSISKGQLDQLHCAIGISTEAGELLDAFKKSIYYKKELDAVNVGEEVADIMWYVSNLCRLLNLDFEKLLQNNINKLKIRFPDKFNEQKALNRDLDSERTALEK